MAKGRLASTPALDDHRLGGRAELADTSVLYGTVPELVTVQQRETVRIPSANL
jgi:hypothetical protein